MSCSPSLRSSNSGGLTKTQRGMPLGCFCAYMMQENETRDRRRWFKGITGKKTTIGCCLAQPPSSSNRDLWCTLKVMTIMRGASFDGRRPPSAQARRAVCVEECAFSQGSARYRALGCAKTLSNAQASKERCAPADKKDLWSFGLLPPRAAASDRKSKACARRQPRAFFRP
jgi:hypothetical protein